MPNRCALYSCGRTPSKDLTFHKFPLADENRLPIWMQFVGRGSNWFPKKSSRLCSLHFQRVILDEKGCVTTNPTIKTTKQQVSPPKKINTLPFSNFKIPLKISNPDVHFTRSGIYVGRPDKNDQINDLSNESQLPTCAENVIQHIKFKNNLQVSKCTQTVKESYEEIVRSQNSMIKRLIAKQTKDTSIISNLKRKLSATQRALRLQHLQKVPIAKSKAPSFFNRLKLKNRYAEETRQFAMTLHFYSSKAYNFVRNSFNKVLPHPGQINRWTKHIDVEPGFLMHCLETLRIKSFESKQKLFSCLQLDEMSIRQQLISNGEGYDGFVNYAGLHSPKNKEELAKNALFVMAVAVNGHWKIPIGYFLTSGITAEFLAKVITRSIQLLDAANIHCINVTYDGLSSNLKAAKILGANLELKDTRPWFVSSSQQKIFITPDVCHMLKLLRNLWKKAGTFYLDARKLQWNYIRKLEELQQKEGLRAANKLTCRHVNFESQIMKVRFAAQIFSSSIANALRLCNQLKIPGFDDSDCLATADFIEIVDRLFDCLNSRNPLAKNYSAAMSQCTEPFWRSLFQTATYALSNLKLSDGKLIINTKKKTPLIGFLVAIKSVEGIYSTYVENSRCLKYILTYKFSQDHTETFFSTIRSCQGYNNNPNVNQLKYSLRKILSTRTAAVTTGNCIPQDNTELTLTRFSKPKLATSSDNFLPIREKEYGECLNVILRNLSTFSDCVVTYIAGWVVNKLKLTVKCNICSLALESMVAKRDLSNPKYQLIRIKQNGGLKVPSEDVVKVCNITERVYREYSICQNFKSSIIVAKATEFILEDIQIFRSLRTHILDLSPLDNHIHQMVKLIAKTYCTVRMHYNAKVFTLDNKRTTVRNLNTKMTLFGGF